MSRVVIATILAAAITGACSNSADPQQPSPGAAINVSVLPDQSREQLLAQYGPLIDYLEATTGLELEFTTHSSYAEFLDSFKRGDVELAWFGGVTFVEASRAVGAVPLVMRDTDLRFTSHYIVAADADGESLDDFVGARFSFGSQLSTSGHLMPRYFMSQADITPEAFFASVEYSGAHDKSAANVSDGLVDIAVANSVIIDSMFADGRLSRDAVRILQTTPPYPDYVWATTATMGTGVRAKLQDAFLALDKTQPAHAAVLAKLSAGGFLPASDADFDELRAAAEALNFRELEAQR